MYPVLGNDTYFEDDDFPATLDSVYLSKLKKENSNDNAIVWKRPSELVEKPIFFYEGANRSDVNQGSLKNCWFAAAIANLTMHKELFNNVVLPEQTFEEPSYNGSFVFKFWRFGVWVRIEIDDRLPTVDGKLIYMHSSSENEFWPALLEKAYAKFYGCYESLELGSFSEAIVDLTGGISDSYKINLKSAKENFNFIQQRLKNKCMMSCSIGELSENDFYELENMGFFKSHCYSIIGVKKITLESGFNSRFISVRNPWGFKLKFVSDNTRRKGFCGTIAGEFVTDGDGEFSVDFVTFSKIFTDLEICYLSSELFSVDNNSNFLTKFWNKEEFQGTWTGNFSAGGCVENRSTFLDNPQYVLKLIDHDPEDDEMLCPLIISLIQKDHRTKHRNSDELLMIGFSIFCIEERTKRSKKIENFKDLNHKYTSTYKDQREVINYIKLPPGNYCIIPTTYEPNQEGRFFLRIFNEQLPEQCFVVKRIVSSTITGNMEKEMWQSSKPKTRLQKLKPNFSKFKITKKISIGKVDKKYEDNDFEILKDFFLNYANVSNDESMGMNSLQLYTCINYIFKITLDVDLKFTIEECELIITIFDMGENSNKQLTLREFIYLWKYIKYWIKIFKKYDLNNDHMIDSNEFKKAFLDTQKNLDSIFLEGLILKFSMKQEKNLRSLSLNSFINCCIRLRDSVGNGNLEFN